MPRLTLLIIIAQEIGLMSLRSRLRQTRTRHVGGFGAKLKKKLAVPDSDIDLRNDWRYVLSTCARAIGKNRRTVADTMSWGKVLLRKGGFPVLEREKLMRAIPGNLINPSVR